MNDLNELLREVQELNKQVKRVLRDSTFQEYDDLSELDIDYKDGEQLFLQEELRIVLRKLEEASNRLNYLERPIIEVSKLHKNSSGRYETESGDYYTSGDWIEALIDDGYRDVPFWARTSVEHNGKDYYLVGYQSIKMDGLTVRIRRRG